MYAKKVVAGS